MAQLLINNAIDSSAAVADEQGTGERLVVPASSPTTHARNPHSRRISIDRHLKTQEQARTPALQQLLKRRLCRCAGGLRRRGGGDAWRLRV